MSARPGRIKLDREVTLPHPRSYAVKTTPVFMLKAELTEQVRIEVLAAHATQMVRDGSLARILRALPGLPKLWIAT